jgi:hypothetical protein
LYFKFSHLIFDGVGAERFLQWVFSDAPPPSNPGLLTSSHLNEWKKQMECGRKFRELFLPENDNEVAALCGKEDSETGLISRTWEFSQIAAEAEKEAGPFMMIPFLVSECVEALDPFLPKTGDVVVPVMVDQRGQEDQDADSMLFNHWSLQPLLLPEPARKVEKERIAALKHSFFESSAQRAAYLFRHAAFPVRFVPFRLMRYLEQKYGARLGGTFLFSYMDNSVLEQQYIGQSKVRNVRHYPVMPPRPGLGFVFTRFGNDLHLTVSYRKGILPNGELLESNLETLFKHGVKDDI